MNSRKILSVMGILVLCLLITSLFASSNYSKGITKDNIFLCDLNNQNLQLSTVDTLEKLKEIMKNISENPSGLICKNDSMRISQNMKNASFLVSDNISLDYSKTNVQVDGVDEADVVKTDGEYIYKLNSDCINIIKAYPEDKAELINKIKFEGNKNIKNYFYPNELYIDGNYLVVIGIENFRNQEKTKIFIYNIHDKKNIKLERDLAVEGSYLSSRKINNVVYIVSNRYIDLYRVINDNFEDVPKYYDSNNKKDNIIGLDKIKYFPGCSEANYLLVASIKIDNPQEKASVSAFLGSGNTIYMSQEHLYVTALQYSQDDYIVKPVEKAAVKPVILPPQRPLFKEENTVIYKFDLKNEEANLSAKGVIPGVVLNQFSMDEKNGYFRVAATRRNKLNGRVIEDNNIYILDGNLEIAGKIEGIAENEKIYSVRYIEDRAYMVTFKQVDPLFVIDLKNPQSPKILGKLKIPGYSTYLHPYDESHIIGFGKDTIEIDNKDNYGRSMGTTAFYQGLKIAIFDVSDVNNPKEEFIVKIGDRGTDSELLYNHKALLFSRDKNIIAFPVRLMEVDKNVKYKNSQIPQYGKFSYQGAYVYNIDLKDGFKLKGRITHMTDEDYKKSGDYMGIENKNVERILYIGDNLYTLSQYGMKINKLDSMEEVKSIGFK